MSRAQQALFPCVFLAVLALVFLTSLISNSGVAEASSNALNANDATATAPTADLSSPNQADSQAAAGNCSLPAAYPDSILQWCSAIETQAQKYNLDARLIAAVMLEESGGNPNAYSRSGAVGLMQVMPSDGLAASFTCSGNPCFASRPTMNELYDPTFNIGYGARMLAGLISKYGSVRDALKAYGPKDYGYNYADIVLQIFQSYQ